MVTMAIYQGQRAVRCRVLRTQRSNGVKGLVSRGRLGGLTVCNRAIVWKCIFIVYGNRRLTLPALALGIWMWLSASSISNCRNPAFDRGRLLDWACLSGVDSSSLNYLRGEHRLIFLYSGWVVIEGWEKGAMYLGCSQQIKCRFDIVDVLGGIALPHMGLFL